MQFLVECALDAVDLVEKSEVEGWKLRRASCLRRSLIDGGRVYLCVRTRLAAAASAVSSLPALWRAKPRSASWYFRTLHDKIATPVALTHIMRPLLASLVSV